MRNKAEKRHNDWRKAIRKRNLSHYYGHWTDADGNEHEYYDNLLKTYYNFKIESEMMSNIENEYKIKKELSDEII